MNFIKSNCVHEFDYLLAFFFNLLWGIWIRRNKLVFESNPIDPVSTIHCAQEATCEFLSATTLNRESQNHSVSTLQNPSPQHWTLPSYNYIKINVDDGA